LPVLLDMAKIELISFKNEVVFSRAITLKEIEKIKERKMDLLITELI
jgi:hypothetical protein